MKKMNDKEIEIEIIKNFIVKSKQERLIWELGSPRKRDKVAFMRLCDYTLFKQECLQPLDYMGAKALEKFLFQQSGAKEVYYIGMHYIGKRSLRDAALDAEGCDICIIYCGDGIAYYQGEIEYGGAPRFLMTQKSQ